MLVPQKISDLSGLSMCFSKRINWIISDGQWPMTDQLFFNVLALENILAALTKEIGDGPCFLYIKYWIVLDGLLTFFVSKTFFFIIQIHKQLYWHFRENLALKQFLSLQLHTTSVGLKESTIPVTLIPGDGVGPELMDSVQSVFKSLGAPVTFETMHLSEVSFK